MPALLAYVRNPDTRDLLYAIVADDNDAQYVWRNDEDAMFDDERLNVIIDARNGGEDPDTAEDWLRLASYNLGLVSVDEPITLPSLAAARSQARKALSETTAVDDLGENQVVLRNAATAASTVSQDYPDLFEGLEDDDIDTQGMTNYVMMALGAIDPNGPNGWILRAVDGVSAPGDDLGMVTFRPPISDTPEE